MEISLIITAITLGLAGSLHCLGMCGPFALSLNFSKTYKNKLIIQNTFYQTGRAITYAILGILAGVIGIGAHFKGWMGYLSIAIGIIMIISAFFSFEKLEKITILGFVNQWVTKLKIAMSKHMKNNSYPTFFFIGILNGFLPCGLVYTALISAIAVGGVWKSSLYMFIFGLGTIPLMFILVFFGNKIKGNWRNTFEKIIPFIIALAGIMLIMRGYAFITKGGSCCH